MRFNPALSVAAVPAAILVAALLRKSSLRRRGAALAGIAAFWLWGVALTLSSFLNYCQVVRMKGTGDPVAAANAVGELLINAAVTAGMTAPLLIGIAVAFFFYKPQVLKEGGVA